MLNWNEFLKIDMRTGTILKVEPFPEAHKAAWKLTLDFGPLGLKKTSAQITDLYDENNLIGRQVVAVVNFPPKQIANFFSECLVLGVADEEGKIVLLQTAQKVKNGQKIH
ncbi:MAG: tRNA-binding protein [Verrucomicrobia bacterium]|nr:tRNA-binding protein [Verrucomicrobiota bacterium]